MRVSREAVQAIEDAAKNTLMWPEAGRNWETDKGERFRSLFGAPPVIIAKLWMMIEPTLEEEVDDRFMGAERKHLLYALVFLKVYAPNEEAHCAIVDWPCKKTFCKLLY